MALSRTVTLRPSGTRRTSSSARTVSPALNASTRLNSSRETSRPSERRKVSTSSSCSGDWSSSRRPSTMRVASRLKETGAPVPASKTTTPTGEVSTSVSRSVRARRSSRCLRALAMTIAAWEANITSVSSSSSHELRAGLLSCQVDGGHAPAQVTDGSRQERARRAPAGPARKAPAMRGSPIGPAP